MTTSGEGWSPAGMAAAGLAGTTPGPRPGLAPLLTAAVHSLIGDGFRILVFVIGAFLLASLVLTTAVVLVTSVTGDLTGGSRFPDSPVYQARSLAILPAQALVHAVLVAVIVGYIGVRMPGRMIAVSTVPEATIRRGTALIGALLLAVVTWFVLPLRLTPVLAVGVVALPFVFAVAALTGPRHAPVAKGVRPYLALAGAVVVGAVAMLGFLLFSPTGDADLAQLGQPASAAGISVDPTWWHQGAYGHDGVIEGGTWSIDLSPEDQRRIASLRTEVHAADVRDGRLLLGDLLVTSGSTAIKEDWREPAWSMPAPRAPRLISIVTIATLTDGTEVVLDPEPTVMISPEWDGTLVRYLFGGVAEPAASS